MATQAVVPDSLVEAVAELPARARGWRDWLGPVLSLAIVVAALYALSGLNVAQVLAAIPRSPWFFLAFVAFYLTLPASELVIYRRLWNLPFSGIVPLLRKYVGNEILLGYIGEVYFYGWARKAARLTAAPFAAIKDVTILSGFSGNVITLAFLAAAWPFSHNLRLSVGQTAAIASIGLVALMSLAVVLLRRRLFSLPPVDLRFITAAHILRLLTVLLLTGIMWHLALPDAPISWWVLLATLRMLVSRLPFVPQKEVVFAALSVELIGANDAVSHLIAAIAGLTVATHAAVGAVLGIVELVRRR